MNILFFLTPKQDVAFIYDDFTVRQTLEKMEHHRYSSIPILNRKGEYVGTITEGCGASKTATACRWHRPRRCR